MADESRCYRHPKVATALSCGRCERPICTRCAINGPAGIRCRECSRHKVAVRPGAIVHEARRSVSGVFRGGPWTIYALMALVSIGLGVTRGCGSQREPRPAAEVEASVSPEAEPVRSGESASPR